MMQMLEAVGLEIARDDRRPPDADNPRGYYELDAVRRIREDPSFVGDLVGRAVKIVAPLVRHLPEGYAYRVLFLDRDMGEILASQRAMLRRRGAGGGAGTGAGVGAGAGAEAAPADEALLARAFAHQLADVKARLAAAENVSLCVVEHRDLLEAPETTCARITRFLEATGGLDRVDGGPIDASEAARRMAAVVDPSLHRQRAARCAPTPGD
jgi:hypothetical protein